MHTIKSLTQHIARRLATTLAFPGETTAKFIENIGTAAILHDIGNIEVPPGILAKQGRLDEAEVAVVHAHTGHGARFLRQTFPDAVPDSVVALATEIAEDHHERMDGSGYPRGIAGDAIPLASRIVAVADVYSALTCPRPHREAWSHEKALEVIREGRGKTFDPDVVDALLDIVDEWRTARIPVCEH
jgi:HD-GYP domain-containing protein (c-di-GMP phosphodiesterase class II)